METINDIMEADTMLAERIEGWFEEATRKGLEQGMQQGLKQGIKQGLKQGEAQVLLRQLTLRFGELTEMDRRRIDQADAETLLSWSERVLSARTLDEVWG